MKKRQVFSLLLPVALLCSACSFSAQEMTAGATPDAASLDSAVSDGADSAWRDLTIGDVTLIQRIFAEKRAASSAGRDIDSDGAVTVEDARLMQLILGEYIDTVEPADTAKPLTLGETAMALGVGEQVLLTTSYGTQDSALGFLSSDPKTATVDAGGIVKAVGVGTAELTAVSRNGQYAVCTVRVGKAPTALSLNEDALYLRFGEQFSLKAVLPKGEATHGAIFSSSDSSVAEVDPSGIVTAMKAGEATVTAKTYNGKTAACQVTVVSVPPIPESVSRSTAMLGVGEFYPLTETLADGLPLSDAVFVSSDPEVASVDEQTGDVIARAPGYATISLCSQEEAVDLCYVSVRKAPTEVAFLNPTVNMLTGERAPFTLRPVKADEALFGASFVSSDPAVCAVTPAGEVTANRAGTATLTATAYNGAQASVTVTVLDSFSAELKTTTAAAGLLRDAAWSASPIVTVPKGAAVKVFDTSLDGRWEKVQYGGYCGWLYNKALGVKTNCRDITAATLPAALDDYIFECNADIYKMYDDILYAMDYRTCDEEDRETMAAYMLRFRRGACYQRAALMCCLLERMGYDTIYASGTIPMYDDTIHRWTMVKTEEGWRHIDATPVWGPDYYMATDAEMDVFVWDESAYPAAD